MPRYGFSTGALFKDALAEGVAASVALNLHVIELSALRLRELDGLIGYVTTRDLSSFGYVSIHAPTDFTQEQERGVAGDLLVLARKFKWHVVVHPDCLCTREVWEPFGELLCIENMDKRKAVGRTVEELAIQFDRFPAASLCFDIAHAHQVDTSMTEAFRILRSYEKRICQLHVSEVTSTSKHDRISESVLGAFQEVSEQLPRNVPVIMETPVTVVEAPAELAKAARLFKMEPVTIPS
jgi:hypothetical protein